jgi:hypothetical protein
MTETIETPARSFERVPSESAGENTAEQLIITRDAKTGDVVSVETIDTVGRKTAVPSQTMKELVGEDEFSELADVLDEAFDSGLTALFDESGDDEDDTETGFDRSALLRALVIALAGRRGSRRLAAARNKLMHKLILRRLVRRYFLRQAAAAP